MAGDTGPKAAQLQVFLPHADGHPFDPQSKRKGGMLQHFSLCAACLKRKILLTPNNFLLCKLQLHFASRG